MTWRNKRLLGDVLELLRGTAVFATYRTSITFSQIVVKIYLKAMKALLIWLGLAPGVLVSQNQNVNLALDRMLIRDSSQACE
jgi:hypothetical protein